MTPKQTDSELWAMFSNGDGTMGQVGFRDSLHQREQQIYAELMEKIEEEQSKYTEILDNSFWINQGIASVKTIINNIFKHENN